jgi:hypothetical protein
MQQVSTSQHTEISYNPLASLQVSSALPTAFELQPAPQLCILCIYMAYVNACGSRSMLWRLAAAVQDGSNPTSVLPLQ